jgi:hypothetical protein
MDQELKQYLEGMESRLESRVEAHFDEKMGKMEERVTEKMRDMQTELLRGFAAFAEVQTIRLKKVEADQSNLDTALSGRVNVIEKRLLEIELRLGRAS